jgi:cysteine dioxygenase
MKQIISIDQLITILNTQDLNWDYFDLMSRLNIPEKEFSKYYRWNKQHYTRNCIVKNKTYELSLICFEEGQQTPIFSPGQQEAWLFMVSGSLKEEQYLRNEQKKELKHYHSISLNQGDYVYRSYKEFYRYSNRHNGRSVCLNLCIPPNDRWEIYLAKGKSKKVSVSCDSLFV